MSTALAADRAERRRAVVRDEMVEAAWALARDGGVGAVTIKNVADRMGMKPPSLYEYVPNLHGLFDLLFQAGWQQFQDEVDALATQDADPRTWFRRFLEFWVEDPARFQLLLQRPVPGFEPSKEAMAVSEGAYRDLLAALAGFGIKRRADVDLVDSLLVGLAGDQIANDPGGTRFVRLADEAVDLLLRHIKRRAH